MTDVKMLYLATVAVRILHRPFRLQPWSCIIGSVRANDRGSRAGSSSQGRVSPRSTPLRSRVTHARIVAVVLVDEQHRAVAEVCLRPPQKTSLLVPKSVSLEWTWAAHRAVVSSRPPAHPLCCQRTGAGNSIAASRYGSAGAGCQHNRAPTAGRQQRQRWRRDFGPPSHDVVNLPSIPCSVKSSMSSDSGDHSRSSCSLSGLAIWCAPPRT